MTLYALILFLHLTGAVLLFLAFGIEWTAVSFLGKSATAAEAQNWLRLGRLAPIVNGPALLLIILSGGYLASLTGAMKQGWIPATFIGIAIVVLLGVTINVPFLRKIRLTSAEDGEKLLPALRTKALPVSVRLRVFTALGIIYLMAAKLTFAQSMLVLLIALLGGLFFSIPVFTRKSQVLLRDQK